MRRLVLLPALGLAAALLPLTPASAQGAAAFTGNVHISCFGCGVSSGTAQESYVEAGTSFTATGSRFANFNVIDALPCPIEFTMNGNFTGVTTRQFHRTVLGAVLVDTELEANRAYWGVGTFVIASPVGIPCGAFIDAVVAGVLETTSP